MLEASLLADLIVELPNAVRLQRLVHTLREHFRCGAVGLLRLDGAIDSPPQLATVIGQALGIQLPPLPATQRRMPPGRWRDYADELAGPFERLAAVAARLGYPDA